MEGAFALETTVMGFRTHSAISVSDSDYMRDLSHYHSKR